VSLSTLFPYTTLFRSRADGGVAVWFAIVLNGAPVSGPRLGRGPLPQTARAHVGFPRRHRLVRAAGLALARQGRAPGEGSPHEHRSEEHTSELQSPYDL